MRSLALRCYDGLMSPSQVYFSTTRQQSLFLARGWKMRIRLRGEGAICCCVRHGVWYPTKGNVINQLVLRGSRERLVVYYERTITSHRGSDYSKFTGGLLAGNEGQELLLVR